MATDKNFVDFIAEAQKDRDLALRFMGLKEAREIKDFFAQEGYQGISDADIEKINKLKNDLAKQISGQADDDYY